MAVPVPLAPPIHHNRLTAAVKPDFVRFRHGNQSRTDTGVELRSEHICRFYRLSPHVQIANAVEARSAGRSRH